MADPSPPRGRTNPLHWAAALLPAVLLGVAHLDEGPGLLADDPPQYLLHARALLEGRPYTDIGYIYTPLNPFIGPPAEPPGFPVTLWALFTVSGFSPFAAKLFLIVVLLAFLGLAGRYLARDNSWLALGAVFLTAVSLQLQRATTRTESDLGFSALLWAVFLLSDRPGRWSPGRLAGITLLGSAALLYRLAAAPLVPAVIVLSLLRRRELTWLPAVPAVVWTATFVLTTTLLPTAAVAEELDPSPARLAEFVVANAERLRVSVFRSHLYPFPSDLSNDVYHLATAALMVLGLAAWVRQRPRALLTLFAAAYVAMVLLLPKVDGRYLWPLYPLFGFGLLDGTRRVGRFALAPLPPPSRARVAVAAVVGLAVAAVAVDKAEGRYPSLRDRPTARELFGCVRDLARHETLRVSFFKPRTFTLETGVPAMGRFAAPPEVLLGELRARGITHVVLGDLGYYPEHDIALRRLMLAHSDRFALECRNPDFALYRVER